MQYSDSGFAEFVSDNVDLGPDETELQRQIFLNMELAEALYDQATESTTKRVESGKFSIRDIPTLKAMELMEAFTLGFHTGVRWEKADYNDIRHLDFGGDNPTDDSVS